MSATPTTQAYTSDDTFTPARIRYGILVATAVLTVGVMLASLFFAVEWYRQPFLGATFDHTMTVNPPSVGGDNWNGIEAGLRQGDVIITIDGEPVSSWQDYERIAAGLETSDAVTVEFLRLVEDGAATFDDVTCSGDVVDGFATCQAIYALGTISAGDFLALFVVPFVSSIVVLIIVVALIRARPYDVATFMAALASLMLAIFMAGIFNVGSSHQLVPVWLLAGILVGGLMISFGMIFPQAIPPVRRQPWLAFMPTLFAAALAVYSVMLHNAETPQNSGEAAQILGVMQIIGAAILFALMFFYQRVHALNSIMREQANTVSFGIILTAAPGVVWVLGQILRVVADDAIVPLSLETMMPFLLVAPLSLAYAVLRYGRYDSDRLISQTITYSIMMMALIVGYFLLITGAALLTTESTIDTDNPLLIVITIFFVSLLFVPLRTRLQDRIDAIYYRKRYDYQNRLEDFSQRLTSLAGIDVMIHEFRELLEETVQPSKILVFLRDKRGDTFVAYGDEAPETDITFTSDSGTVELLENSDTMLYLQKNTSWQPELYIDRPRLEILGAMVLVGMPGTDDLNGFVSLAEPESGMESYTFEEIRFIGNLVGQLAVAVERSQVITSLQQRVEELNVLSKVGQAVNYAIEADDLLELLSAQTLSLFKSPFFYIVLLEESTNQLYFAFFQEYNERDLEKENKKWPYGRDLFSEVMEKESPTRLDDYAATMQRNNYRIGFEDPDIKAWMAVPLTSGSDMLGVIAIGESDPEVRYTEEQLGIFSNIGALAATSLEKANLFNEANARARQLSALNDVTREMVATEEDIEKLLKIITRSAVDILDAEAGSLLLTVQQGSGLEFRAAVGSTGEKLIGTKLPAGHGLVGQVATTGKPVISNDISVDERWEGEVSDDFSTDSILAVPLVAKRNVVGVLEVINKLNGTPFVEDDLNLLTAFAGQAAIAIENARLREQTGLQLNQRLEELEALERIDRELNQTLDIDAVAAITVRGALSKSNATAGVLGVLSDGQPGLRVLARSGYQDDEIPEGAEDGLWPTDRGIVKRVMRTRRPDLQPDVSIDPDYVPSLRNALSQITVPMFSGDEINAVLILETDQEPALTLLDLDWVQRLAEHASIAIANAQLYAEIMSANETKSEFIGFAAHELKNPLTSVKGYASLLTGSMSANFKIEDIQKTGNIIEANAERMQNIIDDLRDIARDDAGRLKIDLEPVSVRSIVNDTLMSYHKQIEDKNQSVVNAVDESLPLIQADANRLVQVLTNFVSNAHKYSPENATITIGAEVMKRYTNRRGKQVGDVMKITVTDTGIGMSEEDLKRIFVEDYFRSSNELAKQQKGTGLGMIITQRIIQGHGGEVWVESTLGEGSTFAFVIPLAPRDDQKLRTGEYTATEPASD